MALSETAALWRGLMEIWMEEVKYSKGLWEMDVFIVEESFEMGLKIIHHSKWNSNNNMLYICIIWWCTDPDVFSHLKNTAFIFLSITKNKSCEEYYCQAQIRKGFRNSEQFLMYCKVQIPLFFPLCSGSSMYCRASTDTLFSPLFSGRLVYNTVHA